MRRNPASPSASTEPPASTPTTTTPTAAGAVVVPTPAECDDVELSPAATVTGDALAACVEAFSRAAGSGHEYLLSGDTSGEVDFVYGDAPQMAGSVTGPEGTTSFVIAPPDTWVTVDGAWVHGDPASSDPREALAGTIGAAYQAAADPAAGRAMIAASSGWTVQTDQDVVALPDGSEVHAWRVQADQPFAALGAEVQEMVVWLTGAHAVVGNQATVSVGGVQTTTLQQYTRWGEPVEIAPPVS